MSYRYTLHTGNNTYILDGLINSANTTIKTPLCSTELKSASGSLSFSLIGARNTALYSTVMQAILTARDNVSELDTEITLAEIDDTNDTVTRYLFRGYLDNNNFSLASKILPENTTLSVRDKTTLLDTKIRFNRIYENKTRKYILQKLLEDLTTDTGITATLLSYPSYLNTNDYKISNWCCAEDNNETYRQRIDTLLYEAPGCVLYYDHNSNGYRVTQLPTNIINNYSSSSTYKIGDLCKYNNKLYRCNTAITSGHAWVFTEWNEVQSVDYLSNSSSLQTNAGVYKYDGILLKYPTVATKQNQNLYAENISTSVDSDGNIKGLDVVDDGYFPENGDITATYQQYSDEGLDRAYLTKESRKKNEDIALMYAKDCEYVISQHPDNACTLVTDPLPNIGWTGSAQYYPKKAWVLLKNNSGTTATITGFSVQGTAIYKSKMNKLTVPSVCSTPEEYETETIFENTSNSDAKAKEFAQWVFNAKKYGVSTSSWEETELRTDAHISSLGEVVNVIHKETGVAIPHIVVQVDSVGLFHVGTARKYKVTAVSISGYTTYISKKISNIGSVGTPANANKVLITSRQFALSSSDVTAPTTGWTSDRSSLTPTLLTPYIWSRETLTYGDGSTQTSNPYVLEVYTTTEVMEYSLKVSPSNIIKNLRSNGTQQITLSAKISGYSGYVINYSFNGSFVGSTYTKATEQIAGETYYTFAQTSDQTPQTGKTYYTKSGTSPNFTYTECVNLTAFVGSYTNYYERTTVSYSSGVYKLDIDSHSEQITINIPYSNIYVNNVICELYNGSTLMDSVQLSVVDQTGLAKFLDLQTQQPPQNAGDGNLISGDYFVVGETDFTYLGVTYLKGRVYEYVSDSDSWILANTSMKLLDGLKSLLANNVNLSNISDSNTVTYLNSLVANNVVANTIKASEGFFNGITLENVTFKQGDLKLAQIETVLGSEADTEGRTLPNVAVAANNPKWELYEIYNDINTPDILYSSNSPIGNMGGTNIYKAVKLVNPNSQMYPPSTEYLSNLTTQSIYSISIDYARDFNIDGYAPYFDIPSYGEYWSSDVTLIKNGETIGYLSSTHYTVGSKSIFQNHFNFSFSALPTDNIQLKFGIVVAIAQYTVVPGSATINKGYVSFQSGGLTNIGLWIYNNQWTNLGYTGLYPTTTNFTLTLGNNTYTKTDHYINATQFATYNYYYTVVTPQTGDNPSSSGWYEKINGNYVLSSDTIVVSGKTYYERHEIELNRTYDITSSDLTYYGNPVTAEYFKRISNTSAIITLTNGNTVLFSSSDWIYMQGSIFIAAGTDGIKTQTIYPSLPNTYNLGETSNRWKNVHAINFFGNVTGNVNGNASSATTLTPTIVTDANPDTMFTAGMYEIQSLASGAVLPVSVWADMVVINYNTNGTNLRVTQIVKHDNDNATYFIRTCYGGTWSGWLQIWTSASGVYGAVFN